MHVLRTAFETAFVLELTATIATALVAVEVGLRLAGGTLAFAPALAVLIVTPEFFAPLRQLSVQYHAGATGKVAAERVFAILDTQLPRPVHRMEVARHPPVANGISFRDVSFSYEGSEREALTDVSFDIPRGSTTALVGETGAGKSTLAGLLLRFFEPTSGAIFIEGLPLDSMEASVWRAQVAWVPQQPHLFAGTVADNIRLGRPNATLGETVAAATAAGADTFIRRLPQGYDTVIGEGGRRLSGGEQQRLAIARAYLKDAPFIILDEPTSHLDAANEALVQEALQRLLHGRTALIISHRMKLVQFAGQTLVLQDGRLLPASRPSPLLVPKVAISNSGGSA
jgi:ATP-binding cassette subfamily C protein CydD